jgi:hypothetical protein
MNPYALKFSLGFSITIVACVFATALWVSKASGQFGGGNDPFGGRILFTVPCLCSGTIWHMIGPPVGGPVIYDPSSTTLYDYGQAFVPSAWQLGLRGSWRDCRVPAPHSGCMTAEVGQVMNIDGTSLY